ncbi:HD domain-containing protein [Candidatus Endomicrobiellum trichonymphae]|uniref:tRNA nucleotidyltransferase n=1 Tax=Endomicrobium trichonymphae TaxID=1408204 RepID=B1GZ64_ENDTX|nr:HD domain-containing protein [Candidatus Endomicrobium trichonymphae]BAG13546.1 tRNA nucleotidyltransferase [Candidatus Endomicrobium trichonymphae]
MNKLIKKINNLSKDFDIYATGGFSRDLLLKRSPIDIDLAVSRNALKYSKKIADVFNSKLITLNDTRKTYRIILKDDVITNIDISLFNGKTIKQDLQNRDFTINATAFNLKNFKNFKKHIILSDRNTLRDLKSKIVNTVSAESFKTDPLRMLRAFRFAAELNFKISKKTFKQIIKNAKLIRQSAPERIKNEFFRVLSVKNSAALIKDMDDCGLLSEIFAEIKKMKKTCRKYYYHPGGLFQHSFETVESAENILNNLKKYFPENYADMQKHFDNNATFSENITRESLLKFAALFHDSAKPETAKFENGKMHFLGHEELGAGKVKEIMLSLKSSKNDIETAVFLVSNHMRPSTLTRNNIVTKKAALKFFRDIGDNTPDLLVLSMSDWHSYKKLKVFSSKGLKLQEKSVRELLKYYYELKNAEPLSKIIDGNIIMKKFNLKPGPWIGELLNFATETQLEGTIFNTDEALKIVFSKLTHIKKKYKL